MFVTTVISVMIHAAVIYFIPSVGFLAQTPPEYIEIEMNWQPAESPESPEFSEGIGIPDTRAGIVPTNLQAIEPETIPGQSEILAQAANLHEQINRTRESSEIPETWDQTTTKSSPSDVIDEAMLPDEAASMNSHAKEIPEIAPHENAPMAEPTDETILMAQQPAAVIRPEISPMPDETVEFPRIAASAPDIVARETVTNAPSMPLEKTSRSSGNAPRFEEPLSAETNRVFDRLQAAEPAMKAAPELAPDEVVLHAEQIERQTSEVSETSEVFSEIPQIAAPNLQPPMIVQEIQGNRQEIAKQSVQRAESESSSLTASKITASLPKNAVQPEETQEKALPQISENTLTAEVIKREMPVQRETTDNAPDAPISTPKPVLSLLARAVEQPLISPTFSEKTTGKSSDAALSPPLTLSAPEEKIALTETPLAAKASPNLPDDAVVQAIQRPVAERTVTQPPPSATVLTEPKHVTPPLRRERLSATEEPPISSESARPPTLINRQITAGAPSSEQSGFGIFVPKQPVIEEITLPQQHIEPEDAVQQAATEEVHRESSAFEIEGPASERKVISKPARLPDVQIEMTVTIRLKFWVLPDGTVGDVVPLQRGDLELERAAIGYVKKWRFTQAQPGSPKVWGIIPITYQLR